MSELKKYYELQKNSDEEYRRFLRQLSKKTTSREFFTTTDGELEPKRKYLHNNITEEYLKRKPSQLKPCIHFILGSIGSGKTSLKDRVIKEKELKSFLYINFDDLKLKLPEYKTLKELNPKKAAHFVQSESSKMAGLLYKKSLQKKVNIIYEKNVRKNKDNKLHIVEEIKKAFKKNYSVTLHVVFLNSYEEAWRRVQKRYEKIKRYVPKKEVKDTFQNLFPNLNLLLNTDFKQEYRMQLWYNSLWNGDIPEKIHTIGTVFFQNEPNYREMQIPIRDYGWVVMEKGDKFYGFFLKKIQFLPKKVKTHLAQVDCLERVLSIV